MLGLVLLLGVSCGPIPDYRTLVEVDLHPPEFLGALAAASRTVVLRFDEAVIALPESVLVTPAIAIDRVTAEESELIITLGADQRIGMAYTVEATVEDERRNSTSVVTSFYGFNPDLPRLCINEFITQGSGKHPDLVELFVLKGGNTAGICLYEGTAGNWNQRKLFPAIEVDSGDYLLVHFKPQGTTEEVDETDRTDHSGGFDSDDRAYDLWVKGGTGLSGNNGVLSLYSCPNGKILDAVVYSNRTTDSDTAYGGFGSRDIYERICELDPTGAWLHEGEHIVPEEAIDPTPSTSTRSMSRNSQSADSNTKVDWHVTPTRGATFGEVNTDEAYLP